MYELRVSPEPRRRTCNGPTTSLALLGQENATDHSIRECSHDQTKFKKAIFVWATKPPAPSINPALYI